MRPAASSAAAGESAKTNKLRLRKKQQQQKGVINFVRGLIPRIAFLSLSEPVLSGHAESPTARLDSIHYWRIELVASPS